MQKTMKKLVLHSDQVSGKTELDVASTKLFTSKNPKIAYIPSQSDDQEKTWFNKKVEWYKQFGITDLLYFDIDKDYDERNIDKLLSCDGVFLSGGNTFYFLNSLKNRNFIPILRDYVEKGGVLIGVSAGSIIMSPTINIATLHDENNIGLKNNSALGLVNFDFFPHLDHDYEKYLKEIVEYSKTSKTVIYACKDGDGIIVEGKNMQFFGDVLKIENGEVATT
jgi:dipeptidase E